MKKHRGLFLGLGLAALLGLSAREVHAETLTLTVELGGSSIFSKAGTGTSVNLSDADLTSLNSALSGTGYTFTGLSGFSNFPGTSGPAGGFVSDSGNLSFAAGGAGGALTIIVTESGFTSPASGIGNTLQANQTATFTGTTGASTQSYTGAFADSTSPTPVTMTLATSPATLNGSTSAAQAATGIASLGTYLIPYTLTNTTVISLDSASTDPNSPGNVVFTGTTSVLATVIPEPASIVMMVTGMPLPLVVMGLLRRRRGAA